ncbi:752_t:CDS:1, partial [Cetraspora pellucida]
KKDYNYTNLDDLQNNYNVNIESSMSNTQTLSNKSLLPKNFKSSVWPYFDIETSKYPSQFVCKQCENVFESLLATSTLCQHLASYNIIVPKLKGAKNNQLINFYTKIKQYKQDASVIK